MSRLKDQWEEFLLVIDSSADTELAIVVAMVLPTLVWVLGAWSTPAVDLSGSFATLSAAMVSAFIGLASILYWTLGSLAIRHYRRARARLLAPSQS